MISLVRGELLDGLLIVLESCVFDFVVWDWEWVWLAGWEVVYTPLERCWWSNAHYRYLRYRFVQGVCTVD